ncbi:hypothetical protein KR038_003588 [Drosophila bunnanda]|nr:hypothetical protein KR038_003588 [Drosophila bunnanda]
MERLFYLPTLFHILISNAILASSEMQIPLEIGASNEQLDNDINSLFGVISVLNKAIGCYSYIAYTGNVHLRPSLEQRLMERFERPIYTIGSYQGPVNHRYKKAENIVIVLFTGLDDPIIKAVNDTELANGKNHYCFLYVPRSNEKRLLTMDEMGKFFSWCFGLNIDRVMLLFHGKSEFEIWSYYYLTELTIVKVRGISYPQFLRYQGFRFSVKAVNDPPNIFWYNSTEQSDVIHGGNISLSGTVGIMIVEFMRYINATMDIYLIEKKENSNYELFQAPGDRRVDLVANLEVNDSLLYSPVITQTQICLLVPHRRMIPLSTYFWKVANPNILMLTLPTWLLIFIIKYIAHHRRSLVDSLFSTLRFNLGVPLPGGQLERLPLADKIMEVYTLLFLGIFISGCGSLLGSALTTGLYYPPITDEESMRASGLRIITEDPKMQQTFRDNRLPSSLTDLVDIVDDQTILNNFRSLNDSVVYVALSHNWQKIQLYQERLKANRIAITGPKLCSNVRQLRLPISPMSPLRFTFQQYFFRVFESGLEQKWRQLSFQKFRETYSLPKLPSDMGIVWKPLDTSFYTVCITVYICCMSLSTLIFIIEILYKRYRG